MTLLPVDEIASVLSDHQVDPGKRHAQQVLAKAVTALVHGQAEAEKAAGASQGFTRAAEELSGADWAELASSLPTFEVAPADLGRDLVEFLAENGAIASRSEGRRLIAQSGLSFNDAAVTEGRVLLAEDFNADGYALARRGKKQRFLLHFPSNP